MPQLKRDSDILATHVWIADNSWSRVKGLLGRPSLPPDEAMWIKPCNSIHTHLMQFPIDVVFADKQLIVKKVYRNIRPGRIVWPVWSAHSVFEFAAGFLDSHSIEEGDRLHVDT
jgi:uncharacterized protein